MTAKCEAYINSLSKLSDNVPLKTPYGIRVSLGNTCDFRCIYCSQFKGGGISKGYENAKLMLLEEFLIIANQISQFDEPIRQVSFVSKGETLLNKQIPDMVKILKNRTLARQVKIVTNANKLTHEMSDKLLNAGLDVLKISLQGLSARKYKEICQVNIDWDGFVDQIRYFYEHRGTCKVQIKIIDIALEVGDEQLLKNIFGDICDYISIEKCIGDLQKEKKPNINKLGYDIKDMKICPLPFYTVNIYHNGDITSCCQTSSVSVPIEKTIIANVYTKSLKQIWQEDFIALQLSLLQEKIPKNSICYGCRRFYSIAKPSDYLDNDKEEILRRYEGSCLKYE